MSRFYMEYNKKWFGTHCTIPHRSTSLGHFLLCPGQKNVYYN